MTLGNYISALLPEILLILGAVGCLFLRTASSVGDRRTAGGLALVALAAAAVVTIRTDSDVVISGLAVGSLSLYVRLITLLVGAVLVLVNWYQAEAEERGEYFSMMLFSLAGVMLAASSNDLIVLFFALELVSVPTYVLVALSRKDIRAQEACGKYFFLGAMASAITAYGLSFLYGACGTTTMFGEPDSIARRMAGGELDSQLALLGLVLTFGGLSFKIAAVPFHGYVADVYQGAAAPLAGLLAFVPKIAGFVGLIKLIGLTGWDVPVALHWMMWIVAVATMTVGNVLALMQPNVKRMLAYSSVAHSGYMLIGLLVGPVLGQGPFYDGLSAMLFYIAVYSMMNLGAFAVLAYLSSDDQEVEERQQLAGLSRREPLTALALAICLFSLMGLPPTAGFLGKVYIFSSAISVSGAGALGQGMIWLVVIGVLNSAVAAAYYLRVVGVCYLHEGPEHLAPPPRFFLQAGTAVCAAVMLVLFLWPGALLLRARRATDRIGGNSVTQFAASSIEQSSEAFARSAEDSAETGD